MRTFENFRKVINESDYILSEAQRYLEILLEKDSEALKQYKASQKSFQKGFGKNIKPTVVQPGLDLYKAGGPFVPDKTTFADTGKKVPKMEKKPQFGTPKTTSTSKTGAPDKTLLKKAIADVKASEKRLFDKGLGKGTAGIKGVEGKKGISLARQRAYTKQIIKDLSAKTTKADARVRGSSTEGSAGASSSSKTVTPTKGVKQSEVSKKAKDFTKEINQKRTTTPKTTNVFNRVKPKGDGLVKNSKGVGNMYRGNSPEAIQLRKQAIAARSGSGVVVRDKVTSSDRVNKGFTSSAKKTNVPPNKFDKIISNYQKNVKKNPEISGLTATGKVSYAKNPFTKDAALGRAVSKEVTKNPTSRLLQTKNLPYLKAASKQKGILRGATRFLGKLGPKGRLIAGGITAALATPGGRNFAKNLALGAGLTGLGLGGKKEKVLKKGDGLKPIGKVDVRYGLTGTSKKGQGGKVYDPKQMAQVGKVQKKFIDKYNQKASKNPFKKQIQYKAKGDGTYKVLDPKKK